jgi:peptidyl-prolyl cis-trans isomerase SurA
MRGENFDKVAEEESENSEMVMVGSRQEKQIRATDLHYFNAFAMPYSIEKFAFNSRIGEFSMPLRTELGFHIVETLDRQPTLGRINASQIFLNVPDESEEETIRLRADSLYHLIISRTRTFEEIARQFSDDRISGMRGGRMAEFNVTRADPIIIKHLYQMPVEVVSRPFRSGSGYHIVIIHNVGEVAEFEDLRSELLFRLQRDARAEIIRQSFANLLRKEYPVIEPRGALRNFVNTLDSSEITGFWAYEIDDWSDSVLVKVGTITATFEHFGMHIENNQLNYNFDDEYFMTFIERNYRRFVEDLLIRNEAENVGNKHEEFNRDFSEYRDAVMVFELTNQRVWRRSTEDTLALYDFYETQRDCFQWPARIQALIFRYDVRHINTENVRRFLEGSFRRRHTAEQIIDQANRNFDPRHISVTVGVYEPGQNRIADRVDWTRR